MGLNDWQAKIGTWHTRAFAWAQLPHVLEKLDEEMHEVQLAFYDGNRDGVADELADCLVCILAAMAREGIDAEQALAAKFERVVAKYIGEADRAPPLPGQLSLL